MEESEISGKEIREAIQEPSEEESRDISNVSDREDLEQTQSSDQKGSLEENRNAPGGSAGKEQTREKTPDKVSLQEDRLLQAPGCSTYKFIRAGKSNEKEEREEDRIEVIGDVDDTGDDRPRQGVPEEASGRGNDNVDNRGNGSRQGIPEQAGGSSRGNRKTKQKRGKERDQKKEDEEDAKNYVYWLDGLPAETSLVTLLCIWVRKFYGWLTLGVVCFIAGLVIHLAHSVLKSMSIKERLVTASVLIGASLAFLAAPLVRLIELFRARGPRLNIRGLRNLFELA